MQTEIEKVNSEIADIENKLVHQNAAVGEIRRRLNELKIEIPENLLEIA